MAAPREPVFLGRDTYRRRRVIDAMRLLPVIGMFLFLVPLLGSADGTWSTAASGIFLFAVWFGLIVIAAALVRFLAGSGDGAAPEPEAQDPAPGAGPAGR